MSRGLVFDLTSALTDTSSLLGVFTVVEVFLSKVRREREKKEKKGGGGEEAVEVQGKRKKEKEGEKKGKT